MNYVDLIIIALLILVLYRGYRIGLFRQLLSLGGFIIGLVLSAWGLHWLLSHGHLASLSPTVITLLILLAATLVGGLIELIGTNLADHVHPHHGAWLNHGLGGAFGLVAMGLSVWLFGIMLSHSSVLALSQPVQQSRIIHLLDDILPPTPTILSDIEHVLNEQGFPEVFAGLEPSASLEATPSTAFTQVASAADAPSVVQIEGDACDETLSGSGFVVAPGVVATDAHVVAGVDDPVVSDRTGTHPARIVYFNPGLDFALLRVDNLSDPALTIVSANQPVDTPSVVLGYPDGGPYTVRPSVILSELTALGRNIYGQGLVSRSIYEVQADVEPGNSGGPLTLANGQVVGMVFARSTSTTDVGYALTGGDIAKPIAQFAANTQAVSSGTCID